MSEREIRQIIACVCADLDRQVRAAVSKGVRKVVLPAALGAGLAFTGAACDDGGGELYGAPPMEASVSDRGVDQGPAVLYGVPDGGGELDSVADGEPAPLYAAPAEAGLPDGGAVALYSAPAPDGAAAEDGGAAPLYAAPTEAGIPDGGAVALYSAPAPDAATSPDGGIAPLYAAPT